MVEKRLKKFEALKEDFISPEFYGNDNYKYLVVCWGSNYNVVKEALENIDNKDLAMLHFSQVYPIPENVVEFLEKAEKIIDVENNATGQFAKLIRAETGIKIDILKFNGMPFSVEELSAKIREELQ
jgi:2-oxoglutarate ferredoxin oxidoreductase subunit alpha